MDDRKRELSSEELRAEKERMHKHSLEYGIEQARARRTRMKAVSGKDTNSEALLTQIRNLLLQTNILLKRY